MFQQFRIFYICDSISHKQSIYGNEKVLYIWTNTVTNSHCFYGFTDNANMQMVKTCKYEYINQTLADRRTGIPIGW